MEIIKTIFVSFIAGLSGGFISYIFNVKLENKRILFEIEKIKKIEQLELYNKLWGHLCDLKFSADDLWEEASKKNLERFSKQLRLVSKEIEKNCLLLEESHYRKLKNIVDSMSKYEKGKGELIDLRENLKNVLRKIPSVKLSEFIEEKIIERNKDIKEEFENLLEKIKRDFKNKLGIN